MRELEHLLGRARGYIEAQPVGPPRSAQSSMAYRRYARRGLEGFSGWNVCEGHARKLVAAGMRLVALERMGEAADRLEAALARSDQIEAQGWAGEIGECLEVLGRFPLRRRGGRSPLIS